MKKNSHLLERKRRENGRSPNPNQIQSRGKKEYLSNIKCFHFHECGHYATKCPHKKTIKKTSGGAESEALTS